MPTSVSSNFTVFFLHSHEAEHNSLNFEVFNKMARYVLKMVSSLTI